MLKPIINTIRYSIYFSILIYSIIVFSIFVLPLFKLNPLSINNNNMMPDFKKGSLVLLVNTDPTEIYIDDVISYTNDVEPYKYDTNRVVDKIIQDRNFIVKGDNNKDKNEEPVSYISTLGKVVYKIPYLGYINNFITEPLGKMISTIAIFTLLVVPYLLKFFSGDR